MARKDHKKVRRALGSDEAGFAHTSRMSNVMLSRLTHSKQEGCSRCFPHGIDNSNATQLKNRRSWKNHRKTKWRRPVSM